MDSSLKSNNKLLTAVLVDDEPHSLSSLENLLLKYCTDVSVAGKASGVDEAYKVIMNTSPAIVFLDIVLPPFDGFDLLKKFKQIPFKIIFVTAHQDYALKAIKHSAIDYLLKPVKISDLKEAVQKCLKNNHFYPAEYFSHFGSLQSNSQLHKIALSSQEGYKIVDVNTIIYCKSEGNYTEFHILDGRMHVVTKPLKEYVEMLDKHNFFRVHKSFLINLDHIVSVNKLEGGEVILTNNKRVPISFRKMEEFISLIKQMR